MKYNAESGMVHDKFNLNTKILGIIGHPIKHSFSPLMHNISFEINNLDYTYFPFDVPPMNLKAAVKGMVALNIKGFNITLPHKETILPLLRNISEEASIIGAVNTVVNDNGMLYGYNTDMFGILETLSPVKNKITGKIASVIGAGGAARSAVYTLIRHIKPEKIYIINRNLERAEALKDYFSTKMHYSSIKALELYPPSIKEILQSSKLIINSTSVGMYPNVNDSVIGDYELFSKDQIIFDMVYNPAKTKLLMLAEAAGAEVLDGLNMFVHQGAKAFQLWTGEEMPVEKIFKALKLYITN